MRVIIAPAPMFIGFAGAAPLRRMGEDVNARGLRARQSVDLDIYGEVNLPDIIDIAGGGPEDN